MKSEFDIFSGTRANPTWVEAVAGYQEAVSRMEQKAREKPGPYFVYDGENQTVVAVIDSDSDQGPLR